ncbi:MAG: hypothetical protein WBZ36_04170 [Candidatus Nitrosopolaris sp.]
MIGVKPVDFNPDGVICNPRDNPINYVWMGETEMPERNGVYNFIAEIFNLQQFTLTK